MNKAIIANIIKHSPESEKKAYIFVNDQKAICEAVITVGFYSLYIADDRSKIESFFTRESFCDFIRNTANSGTNIMDYVFVLGCCRKKTNDTIMEVLANNQLIYRNGAYTLFKDKDYLAKYEKQEELEKVLEDYVHRFEGDGENLVDKTKFCLFGADGAMKGIKEIALVQYLTEVYNLFVVNEELYVYKGGVYFLDEKGIWVKSVIQKLIPEKYITLRNLNNVYGLLLEQRELQKTFGELNDYPAWWINFKNGMYDPKERKLRKHHPSYLSINQIPHELNFAIRQNLEEHGKEISRFLSEAVPDAEDRNMFWEYVGYCMTRDVSFQKMMILKGLGGTGKSRLIHLVEQIVGEENGSSISLQDLNRQFYPSLLHGKLLNACADISSDALPSVDNIKKATGEDVMIYEKKGMDPKPFRPYAKLLFSANEIPLNLDEKSNAFYRRLLILQMNRISKKPDLNLDEKLCSEVDYAIWMAIGGLGKLYQDGKFLESANSKELVEELYRAADSVKAFMDECTEWKDSVKTSRTILYEKYCEYCKGYGRKEHGSNKFYKSLEEKGYRFKRTAEGRYIMDIQFKDEGFLPCESDAAEAVFKK